MKVKEHNTTHAYVDNYYVFINHIGIRSLPRISILRFGDQTTDMVYRCIRPIEFGIPVDNTYLLCSDFIFFGIHLTYC